MDHFQEMFQQAVSLKNSQMLSKRQKFESLPLFFKAGLYYLPKFENVRRQNYNQRSYVSEMLKNNGNQLFKAGEYVKAAREYEQALSIFRFIENKNSNWKNEGIVDEDLIFIDYEGATNQEKEIIRNIKRDLYLNLAICYIKNKEFSNSSAACDEALKLDPKNVKALYRRAQSLVSDINSGLSEFKAALADLKLAHEIDPLDTNITAYLAKVHQDYSKIKEKELQGFRGMYNRNSMVKQEDKGADGAELIKKSETKESKPASPKETKAASKVASQKDSKAMQQREEKGASQKEGGGASQKEEKAASLKEAKAIPPKETKAESNPSNPSKGPDLQKTAQPLVLQDKNPPKEKTEVKKAQPNPGNQVAVKEEAKDQKGNPWEFFNIEKNYNDYNYELSYEVNKEAQIPEEIKELGRFLETRGNEIVQLYERTGRSDQANELKEKLKKAMAAKKQLEKIATLDFSKPTSQLQGLAEKFGLDLQDQSVKSELEKIQAQNIQDIRAWLENLQGGSGEVGDQKEKKTKKEEEAFGKQKKKEASSSEKNKIYINNNFFAQSVNNNSQVINNYTTNNIYASAPAQEIPKSNRPATTIPSREEEMAKLTDLITNMNKKSKVESTPHSNKVTNIMNIAIVAISIILFLATIFLHNFSS